MPQRKKITENVYKRANSESTNSDSPQSQGKHSKNKTRFKRSHSMHNGLYSTFTRREITETGEIRRVARRRWFFILGSLLGAILPVLYLLRLHPDIPVINQFADYVATKFDKLEFKGYFQSALLEETFGNLTSLLFPQKNDTVIDLTPGLQLLVEYENAKPKHPVILIPGIITTGLESWSLNGCSRKYFRQRLWGQMTMFKAALMDKDCWIKNIMLNEEGLDPPDVKLRAAQGLDAGDYFVTGYWVWAKIIENFAAVGYDNNNMHLAAYDWRLSYENLEIRDQYFSKLKTTIEQSFKYDGQKAVVLTHSMGSLVFYYFLKWVENKNGGNGGEKWVETYLDSVINIGGAMLGALKTVPSYISGEQREFVQPMSAFILNRFLNKRERVDILKTWQGMASLLPKGGSKIWGKNENTIYETSDPKNEIPELKSNNTVISLSNGTHRIEYDIDQAIKMVFLTTGDDFKNKTLMNYSLGFAEKEKDINPDDKSQWTNPLESKLPYAPSLKIYCMYGYGNPTERTYFYHRNEDYNETESDLPKEVKYSIQNNIEDKDKNINDGVRTDEGDGSVQLISLGYMCVKGWKNSLLNPSNIKITTREYNHQPVPLYEDIRGGMQSSDHVDILGNHQVTKDVLKIATGVGLDTLKDIIESDIIQLSENK